MKLGKILIASRDNHCVPRSSEEVLTALNDDDGDDCNRELGKEKNGPHRSDTAHAVSPEHAK